MSVYELGLFSGLLTIFIQYTIGKSSGFSPYEIFSSYTVFLSKKRLIKVGIYHKYLDQYSDQMLRIKTRHDLITFRNDFKKMVHEAAEPYFTWEKALGMCSICTGFWISILTVILFYENLLSLTIILISHIVIRLVNKFL